MKPFNTFFDTILTPFASASPWPAMFAISFLTSLIVMIIFKYTSNQTQLKSRKGVLIARLLELHIYRHDIAENIRAFGRVLKANLVYLKIFLKPMLISLLPMVIIFFQAEEWFTYRPLKDGESALVTIDFAKDAHVMSTPLEIHHSDNIEIVAPPVRIPDLNQSVWKISIQKNGQAWLEAASDKETLRQKVVTGEILSRIENLTINNRNQRIAGLSVEYPRLEFNIAGKNFHWILIYIVLVLILALPLKKILRVEI